MHVETAYTQCLVPRLPQRLVGRYAIQLVQVLQAATNQRADQTAHRAAHRTADTCGPAQLVLRRLIRTTIGFRSAARFCAARGRRRWGRRGLVFISVWHVSNS
jgi:hypothetical protein